MWLRYLISLIMVASLAVSAAAETAGKDKIRGPITVTSETLFVDNEEHTAYFEKNVVAKSTDMTLYADKMLVYYEEGSGNVKRIDADGNVKLYKKTKIVTSQKAVYYADEDMIVFTVEPKAVDGENVVTGVKMTYYIDEDRSFVEGGSKVFMKNKKDKGRTKPAEAQGESK